jgi:F-type H+-transporting ATPase subunit delta
VSTATDDRVRAYAESMLAIAKAEGTLDEVSDELFRFARALESSEELRAALTDPHLPASRRQQIVEDLLGGKATPTTVALVSMAVGAGRAKDLPAIIDSLVQRSAEESHKAVAEVRSAVELTEDQRARLAEAIQRATGKAVDVKVVIDPSVLGGIVTTVGDTVIDGSVRSRLEQLKHAF